MKKLIILFTIIVSNISLSQIKQLTISQSKRDSIEINFIKKLNEYRKQNNLPELIIDKMCTKVALEQATYCASIDKLTHDKPNTLKGKLGSHAENGADVPFSLLNDSDSFSTYILNSWKKSKYHNENLLLKQSSFQIVGLSFEISPTNNIYCILFIEF